MSETISGGHLIVKSIGFTDSWKLDFSEHNVVKGRLTR